MLYDAVVLLASKEGMAALVGMASARDFVADAFAHMKFVGYTSDAMPLLEKAGVDLDEAFIQLADVADAKKFVTACRGIRCWERESKVKKN